LCYVTSKHMCFHTSKHMAHRLIGLVRLFLHNSPYPSLVVSPDRSWPPRPCQIQMALLWRDPWPVSFWACFVWKRSVGRLYLGGSCHPGGVTMENASLVLFFSCREFFAFRDVAAPHAWHWPTHPLLVRPKPPSTASGDSLT
jgi:hypothetical protein